MIVLSVKHSRTQLWMLLLLLSAVLAIYGRILGHEFLLNWDDSVYVSHNEAIQGFTWDHLRTVFSSYYEGNYAPVQMLSYMLDYSVWGLHPGGFLSTNIIIHAMNGLLVYRLLFKLHQDHLLAWVGAALFLIHPVQVESVAWISQRKNLLAMFFFLLAWEGYSRYRQSSGRAAQKAYLLSMLAFVLALLSKSVVVIFPLVIVAYDYCFPLPDRRMRLLDKLPFIIAAGCVAVLAMFSQSPELDGGGRVLGFHGGSPLATLFTMLPVFCRYLGMLVWPVGLSAEYTPLINRSLTPIVAASAALLTITFLASLRLFKYDKRCGFWPIVFVAGLVPVSQIVPLVTLMNDRYLYFPILAFSALFGAGVVFLRDKVSRFKHVQLYCLLAMLLIVLSVASFKRTAVWQNSITLWQDAVIKSPNSYTAWVALGEAYHFSLVPQREEALKAYLHALEIAPTNVHILYNLGLLHTEMEAYDKGADVLKRLLIINPNYVKAWAALGDIHIRNKDYIQAEKSYRRAYELQPDVVPVLLTLGELAMNRDQLHQARFYFNLVEAQDGNDPDIAYHLACVESLAGNKAESFAWLEKALQRGYRDFGMLSEHKALAAIRGESNFKVLLQHYISAQQTGH